MRRRCSECHKIITKGFTLFDGDEYYCSKQCLHENYTPNEYEELYKTDQGYGTEWEEDEDD